MCGIAGALSRERSPVELERSVAAMVRSLHHRGPDDSGTASLDLGSTGHVAVGATRLAIQDTSPAGHQPVEGPSGCVLVLNGELYNAPDLRDDLRSRGHRFRGHSDTEVAVAGYEEWGAGVLSRLNGMFALAICDPGRGQLLLARDRLGIKPLYLARGAGVIGFASEARSLRSAGLSRGQIDASGLVSFLATGAVEEPRTIFDDIEAIEPGTYTVFCGGDERSKPFWSLQSVFAGQVRPSNSHDLRSVLQTAVVRHLVSDVPIGVFLSGGIDSTALVGLADAAGHRTRTVSVVFDEAAVTEKQYIDAVVRTYNTAHTEVRLTGDQFLSHVPAALGAMDQPSLDGMNTFVVSHAAKQAGLTVALSGIGGDELFAGYPTFSRTRCLATASRAIPANLRGPLGALVSFAARSSLSTSQRKLGRAIAAGGEYEHLYSLQREVLSPQRIARLTGRAQSSVVISDTALGIADPINFVSYLELSRYMRNVLLRDADVMSMANSLEVRVPFIDHEVVEYVAAILGSDKTSRREAKPLLVAATRGLIPPVCLGRPKVGFTLPFERWLKRDLRRGVEDVLLDPSRGGAVSSLISAPEVAAVWKSFLSGRAGWPEVWTLYALMTWGERLAGTAVGA